MACQFPLLTSQNSQIPLRCLQWNLPSFVFYKTCYLEWRVYTVISTGSLENRSIAHVRFLYLMSLQDCVLTPLKKNTEHRGDRMQHCLLNAVASPINAIVQRRRSFQACRKQMPSPGVRSAYSEFCISTHMLLRTSSDFIQL